MIQATTIKVTIKSPESVLFDGPVYALSAFNVKGPFDLLPMHENFISIIQKEVVVHLEGSEKKSFPVEYGILKVTSNETVVLIGVQTDIPLQ